MPTPYFPQLFTQPAKTFDNPSTIGLVFKGVEQMNKMYYANKENYYKNIKTPIDKLQVDSKDQTILNEARQTITDMMSPVIENDTFHKAEGIVTEIGDYITSNQKLNGAIAATAALQEKHKQILDSNYTGEYKDKYWRYLSLNKKQVSIDEKTGSVDLGVPTEAMVEAYDDKELDALLESVNSMSDYPVTETQIESLVANAKSKGIDIDIDDDGNKSMFVTSTNGVKYLNKERVVKAITAKLKNSDKYMAYVKQMAKLDIFDAQYARTVSETGKAPTHISELKLFNIDDVVQITKRSEFDIAMVLNHYRDDKKATTLISTYLEKGDKSNETAVDSLIAKYYTTQGIDSNSAFNAIYTNSFINNKISSIANPIGNQLAFSTTKSSMQFHNNSAYTSPSQRGAKGPGTTTGIDTANMTLNPFTVIGNVGASIQNTGRELLLASDQASSTMGIYSGNKYRSELSALGTSLDGISPIIVPIITNAAALAAKGIDVSGTYNVLTEQGKKAFDAIKNKYDGTGNLKRDAFSNDGDYQSYLNTSEKYAESRYSKAAAEESYKVWHAVNKPAIDSAVNDYIENNRFFDYNKSYIHNTINIPLLNKYKESLPFDSTKAKIIPPSEVNTFIKENPTHPFSIEAKEQLRKQAVNYMDMEDIPYFKDANIDITQYGNTVFGADPHVQSFINQAIATNLPHNVLYSTQGKSEDKLDVQRILNGSRDTNNKLQDNVKITPYQFSEGGIGAIVTDNVTGDYAIVKFDIPIDQANKFVRLNIDKAYKENRNYRGLQSALIQNNVRNIVGQTPISVNGNVIPVGQATTRVQQLIDSGSAPVIQFRSPLQDVYGDESSNRIISAQAFKTSDGGYAMRIVGVTGITDPDQLAATQQAYFPYDYSYSDEGITYTPKGAASITDLISIIGAQEVIAYKEHQEQNR